MYTIPHVPSTYFLRLHCTEGASDKIYEIEIISVGDHWKTSARWGRRGGALQSADKTKIVDFHKASAVAEGFRPPEDREGISRRFRAGRAKIHPLRHAACRGGRSSGSTPHAASRANTEIAGSACAAARLAGGRRHDRHADRERRLCRAGEVASAASS